MKYSPKFKEKMATRALEPGNSINGIAKAAGIPMTTLHMIAEEMQSRSIRIKSLKATLKQATRQPEEILALLDQIAIEARSDVQELRNALLQDPGARHVYQALFPGGIVFDAVETEKKENRVWALSARAQLGPLNRATPTGFELKTESI